MKLAVKTFLVNERVGYLFYIQENYEYHTRKRLEIRVINNTCDLCHRQIYSYVDIEIDFWLSRDIFRVY